MTLQPQALELVAALGLEESDGVLAIPAVHRGAQIVREWDPCDRRGSAVMGGYSGAWHPVGRASSTAIVVDGVGEGLFLTALLFGVGADGRIYRKPHLPAVLADAVPCALLEPNNSAERDPHQDAQGLFGELEDDKLLRVFLALPRLTFLDEFAAEALSEGGVLTSAAELPVGLTLAEVLRDSRGAAKPHALAGVLNLAFATTRASHSTPTPGGSAP